MPEIRDCAPTVRGTITAMANQTLPGGLKTALAECIDNSFDADAHHVDIFFERQGGKLCLSVRDDGNGCDQLDAFLRIGEHYRSSTTRLGRFGVGAKDAMLWCGGLRSQVSISSVQGGVRRQVAISWERFATDNGRVEFPDPEPASPGERGTALTVAPLLRTVPHGSYWKQLLQEIGYLYAPAIREGRQITLARLGRPEIVARWEPPQFEPGSISTTVTVGGRVADVYCGIVKEGVPLPASRQGLTYWHRFRVIVPASANGCGSYNVGRVCGFVKLHSGWSLSKNKDDIIGADELYVAVEEVCRPVLEKADKIGMTIESEAFLSSVSEHINDMVRARGDSKGKRTRGVEKGTHSPTGEGGPHRKAENEQSGDRFPSRRHQTSYKTVLGNFGDESVGSVKARCITLNMDNQFINAIVNEHNEKAVVVCVAGLLGDLHCREEPSGQQIIRGLKDADFPHAMGEVLARRPVVDGKPLLREVG